LLYKISEESSKNDCYHTGFTDKIWNPQKRKKDSVRFASPIYISVISNNNNFRPIITTLNCAFESSVLRKLKGKNPRKEIDQSNKYKGAIL